MRGWGDWKKLAKDPTHICKAYGHRQKLGEGWGGGGVGWDWVDGQKGDNMGDICNSVNDKKFKKKLMHP